MNLKTRIERLEHEACIREAERDQNTSVGMPREELFFLICHGCYPQELEGKIKGVVRQYTENGLRATIILEAME